MESGTTAVTVVVWGPIDVTIAAEYHFYSAADVARLAGLGPGQVRRWTGSDDHLKLSRLRPKGLFSFLDIVELTLIGRLRDRGVGLGKIRRCMVDLAKRWGTDRPFSRRETLEKLKTCGADLLIDEDGQLEDIDRRQIVLREVVAPYITSLDFDQQNEQAVRWWPRGHDGQIVIDPAMGFGRPMVADHRVPTDMLALGFKAGDSALDLARAYELPVSAVEEALRFEEGLRAAEEVYFFFDENVPKRVVAALRVFDIEAAHLVEYFKRRGVQDEEWMPIVAGKGWVAITQDRRIFRNSDQHALAQFHGLRTVVLTQSWGRLRQHQKAGHLLTLWDDLVDQAKRLEPGQAVKVNTQGEFTLID